MGQASQSKAKPVNSIKLQNKQSLFKKQRKVSIPLMSLNNFLGLSKHKLNVVILVAEITKALPTLKILEEVFYLLLQTL